MNKSLIVSVCLVLSVGTICAGCNDKDRNRAVLPAPNPSQLVITSNSLPVAQNNTAYSAQLAASGGSAPLTWSLVSGNLPPGLTLAPSGAISGIPAVTPGQQFALRFRVVDSGNLSAEANLTLFSAKAVTVTTTTLPSATNGQPYQAVLAAAGGTQPYTWSITSGSLPPGLALAQNGVISGTPTQTGSFAFTAQVVDTANAAGQATGSGPVTLAVQ